MDKKLAQELNKQINIEMQSAYLYFAMAVYVDGLSLDGCARWFRLQAQEELGHAQKIYQYLMDTGQPVKLLAIDEPKQNFKTLRQTFEVALGQEEELATRFNKLAEMSLDSKDNATYSFLKWFLDEQVEEISSCRTIVEKLKLIGDSGGGLFMLSKELGARASAD